MAEIDLTAMSVSELNQLRLEIDREVKRQTVIAEAEVEIEKISTKYLSAVGRPEGAEWVEPTGAHDSYPVGYVATHLGKEWRSLVAGNVWEPGTSSWREVVPEGSPAPEYVQPTGAHDSYAEGSQITFEGSTWTSLINGNVWSPSASPKLWRKEEEAPVDEPPVTEEPVAPQPIEWNPESTYAVGDKAILDGVTYTSLVADNTSTPAPESTDWSLDAAPAEPEEPVVETVPAFKQPTGAHDAYSIGDRVAFNGKVYESKINANTYSPSAYPAGWTLIQ